MYAFGVLLLEMLCERQAKKKLVMLAIPFILRGQLPSFIPGFVKENISPECLRACRNLIKVCLDNDPKKRPSMDQVLYELQLALKLQKPNLDNQQV